MARIIKYVVRDILRSRIILAYGIFMSAASFGLFLLGGDAAKGLVGLLSLVIIMVPLLCLVFATIHFYNSCEFMELLAAQPIRRRNILIGQYCGVAGALTAALLVGIAPPILLYAASFSGFTLLTIGVVFTWLFTALAFLGAVATRDKARGVGLALMVWFYFALLHDGLMLYLLFAFEDYPLEKASIAMIALNPIGMGRVVVLLQMDVSAMMGYTGAMMKELLGTATGIGCASAILLLWTILPLVLANRLFRRKDL